MFTIVAGRSCYSSGRENGSVEYPLLSTEQRVWYFVVVSRRNMKAVETTPDRSALMKRVRQKDTGLEAAVRKVLHQVGARYRMNVEGLPGRPDIANRSRKKAIFIHGCFWHYHETCGRGRIPTRNREFWTEKLKRNVERDRRKVAELTELGYDVLILWGCGLKDLERLRQRLHEFWFADA